MSNFEDRVFLASCEDIRHWGARSTIVLNTLEESDVIFLIKGKDDHLSQSQNKLIQEMKKKADVKVVEQDFGSSPLTGKGVLEDFLRKEGNQNSKKVFIIGSSLECLKDDKKEIDELAETLVFHHNFQVKQLRKKEEPKDDVQYNLLDLMGVTEATNIPKKEPTKEKQMRSSSESAECRHPKQPVHRQEQPSSQSNKNTIERQVFGSSIQKKEYEEYHTQLEDVKALLMLELQNRLHEHIKKELFSTRDTIVLNMSQLLNFTILILKSDSAESFNASWIVTERDPEIKLKEDMFQRIREEAQYYEKVSMVLYEEDIW